MVPARTRWLIGVLSGVLAGVVLSAALMRRPTDRLRGEGQPGEREGLASETGGDAAEARAGSDAATRASLRKPTGSSGGDPVAHRAAAAGSGKPGMDGAVDGAAQSTAAAGQGPRRSAAEARAALLREGTLLFRPADVSRIIESVRSEYETEARTTPEAVSWSSSSSIPRETSRT